MIFFSFIIDGADYVAPFLGFVIIPPAIRQCRFFTILSDVLVEADESLIITLDSLDAVPVTGDSARLTIIDNDGRPLLMHVHLDSPNLNFSVSLQEPLSPCQYLLRQASLSKRGTLAIIQMWNSVFN